MAKHLFKGKVLISDMDGTLLNSKGCLSEQNLDSVRRFVDGGGLFTVATGRMVKTVEPYLAYLPLNIPAIVYNGAAIYDFSNKKLLWQSCLQDDIIDILPKIIDEFPQLGIEIYHGEDVYVARSSDEIEKHLKREKGIKPLFVPAEDIPRPWFKVLLAWEPEKLFKVEEFLKGMDGSFRTVFSEPQFLEILDKNVSKGTALKKLSTMIQYSCTDFIAMGDNLNDYEMLIAAGTGIATENANEALKEAADLCCCHNDKHAVAEVIDWIEKGSISGLAAV